MHLKKSIGRSRILWDDETVILIRITFLRLLLNSKE